MYSQPKKAAFKHFNCEWRSIVPRHCHHVTSEEAKARRQIGQIATRTNVEKRDNDDHHLPLQLRPSDIDTGSMSSPPPPFAIPSSPTDSPAPSTSASSRPPSLQTHKPKRPSHGRGPLLRTPSAGLSPSYSPALPDADEQTPLLHGDSRSEGVRGHDEGDVEAGEKRQSKHRILAWTMRITLLFFLSFLILLIPILHLSIGQLMFKPPTEALNVQWTDSSSLELLGAGKGRAEVLVRGVGVRISSDSLPLLFRLALKAGIGEEGSKAEVEAYDLSAAVYLSGQSEGTDGKEVASLKVLDCPPIEIGREQSIDLRVEVTTGRGAKEAIEEVVELVKSGGGDLKGRVVGKQGGVKVRGWKLGVKGWGIDVKGEVPALPPLPEPASLLRLVSYDFKMVNSTKGTDTQLQSLGLDSSTIKEKLISLTARGILLNPLHPSTTFSKNLPPFLRNLQSSDLMFLGHGHSVPDFLLARVATIPFTFDNSQKEINLTISGWVEPIEPSKEVENVVSRFLSRYLRRQPNEVVFRYDSAKRSPGKNVPPDFVVDVLKRQELRYDFPGAQERLHLLEHVKIEDMKLSLGKAGTEIRASGWVKGFLNLPAALKSFEPQTDITAIWPDIYVYDGEPPQKSANDKYPPEPTPENAFGRLRTPDFAPATTTHRYDEDGKLSWKDEEIFSAAFVSKVIFGKGTQAGIKGKADVRVAIEGITKSGLAVKGVDVQGSFFVGKK
ncbi:hypothetical protein BT69DRAFT_1320034 [Atractiella rhizophila]|nr:hypothetical protein BT69DRAFT_1320034 [Atractiella rhizophila]